MQYKAKRESKTCIKATAGIVRHCLEKEGVIIKNKIFSKSLPLILTLCCAVAIFIFSFQNSNESNALSNGVLSYLIAFRRGVPVEEISYEDLKKYSYIIRKIAHFLIFFTLGIFSCWSAHTIIKKNHIIASFVFCVLYACFDEAHQFFSDGRTPSFKDIIIDSTGAVIGILMTAFVFFCLGRRKKVSDFD